MICVGQFLLFLRQHFRVSARWWWRGWPTRHLAAPSVGHDRSGHAPGMIAPPPNLAWFWPFGAFLRVRDRHVPVPGLPHRRNCGTAAESRTGPSPKTPVVPGQIRNCGNAGVHFRSVPVRRGADRARPGSPLAADYPDAPSSSQRGSRMMTPCSRMGPATIRTGTIAPGDRLVPCSRADGMETGRPARPQVSGNLQTEWIHA